MLASLHQRVGGHLLRLKDFLDAHAGKHPLALEDTFQRLILEAFASHDTVLVDDLWPLQCALGHCNHFYPKSGSLDLALEVVCTYAQESKKRLVFGHTGTAPNPVDCRCCYSGFQRFTADDYEFICTAYLPKAKSTVLDFQKIHRFAPRLNAHRLEHACRTETINGEFTSDAFIEMLRERRLTSNVSLPEVEKIDLSDLKGLDSIIEALETHVVTPFENDALAAEFNLRPKKGVILYGPPGSGKTSVGRALAHRLRGKFFLIDGTIIAGTDDFYSRIHHIFHAAHENAPSIIFIDDADVIWEDNEERGLYRYLLTQLDGLENESSGMVCVMLTVMDVAVLPPALVRSGRFELWLEMALPDASARRAILEAWTAKLPSAMSPIDLDEIAADTEGLTGADLRRLVDDAKHLFAYDRAKKKSQRPHNEYFRQALAVVLEHRKKQQAAFQKIENRRSQSGDGMNAGMSSAMMEHFPGDTALNQD
jgi:ATP-dependent 26S proteasome regulatory subunit